VAIFISTFTRGHDNLLQEPCPVFTWEQETAQPPVELNHETHEPHENDTEEPPRPVFEHPPFVPIEPTPPPPPPRLSPTNLQLALFAHMAFFPFDFNAATAPEIYTAMHYHPFEDVIKSTSHEGYNRYGFNLTTEMEGWYYLRTQRNRETGFSVSIYTCANRYTVILAFRGSYGDMAMSMLAQSGTWWCNMQSLSGARHSHLDSLILFLNEPSTRILLRDANIYITGHSLGGYLAYMALYELAQLGVDDNVKKVVAFSAPLFSQQTVEQIATLSHFNRRKIWHYYVPADLISGIAGVPMPPRGTASTFQLTADLLHTLEEVRGVEVPAGVHTLNNLMLRAEGLLPFDLPDMLTDLIWQLNGAMGVEALEITNRFRRLGVRHNAVPQTWHTPRPASPISEDMSVFTILRNYSPEFMMELATDMILQVFDTDTHFMMNFYSYLTANPTR